MTSKSTKKIETDFIPKKYQHLFSCILIFLTIVIFFSEVIFDGKVFVSSDTVASQSFQTFSKESAEQNIYPLWNPYIFCGMPAYASLTLGFERTFDISGFIYGRFTHLFDFILNKDLGWGLFYYFLLGIGTYFFAFHKLQNKIAAFLTSLATVHSTFIIILITVGHMTKVPVIAYFPFLFLLIEKLREKITILKSLLLIIIIHFMFLPSHLQMIFYIYFAVGIYFLLYLIGGIIKKENIKNTIFVGIIFSVATGIAFLMTSDQYFSVVEYSEYSIRGSGPIIEQQNIQNTAGSVSPKGGLDYEYATNWSFSPEEMITLFVPSYYGFGNHGYKGALTQNQTVRLNTYFGQMPFTDAPQYIGISIIILGVIGFWIHRKNRFVQFLLSIIIISFLISFGKYSIFYDLMFNYFPYFNKFRIPSMILILTQLSFPILAGFGLKSILEEKFGDKHKKLIFRFLIFSGVLFLISFIGKEISISMYQSFFSISDLANKFQGADQNNLNAILTIVSEMVANDIVVIFFISLLLFGGIYLYQTEKIINSTFAILFSVIILFDLWRINYKPIEPQPKRISQDQFTKPQYVDYLLKDTSLFRIVEIQNGQPPYDNKHAFWKLQNAYGYQGAKMRQIQDVFDVVGLNNPMMLSLMNVKYIVSDKPDTNNYYNLNFVAEKYILENKFNLPRAFFVQKYKTTSSIDILNNIRDFKFNPTEIAFFTNEPNLKIDPPSENAKVEFTNYSSQEFELKLIASGNNLLFLSESYYPKGWKAFLDEKEIPIYKLNYMFRGVVVPVGEHKLKMKFEPESFYLGKNLSLWLNIFVIIGILFFGSKKFIFKK